MSKSKKLHIEITNKNWEYIEKGLENYNDNPLRVTPPYKNQHLINLALDWYLGKRLDEDEKIKTDVVFGDNA